VRLAPTQKLRGAQNLRFFRPHTLSDCDLFTCDRAPFHLLKQVPMEDGRLLTLHDQPASVLLSYQKIAQKCSAEKACRSYPLVKHKFTCGLVHNQR
jgi:hypothetical protein